MIQSDRSVRLVLATATDSPIRPSLRSGAGKPPDRVIDVPWMLLLRRERCGDMAGMPPGPDRPSSAAARGDLARGAIHRAAVIAAESRTAQLGEL